MNERKQVVLKMVLAVLLSATALGIFSLLRDTTDVVKITAEPQEEKFTSPLDFFFPSSSSINRWFYGDKIIVAAGNKIKFSAKIFKLGTASIFSGYQKIAIIDVTDDAENTKPENSKSFENYIDDSFPVKKGHKYRFAIYTMNPDKTTELSININGSDKIRTHFANKNKAKTKKKSAENPREDKNSEEDERIESTDSLPDFGTVVRAETPARTTRT